jgi:hypothetical protein
MAQNDVSHEAFLAVNNITPRSLEREKERERERERESLCVLVCILRQYFIAT